MENKTPENIQSNENRKKSSRRFAIIFVVMLLVGGSFGIVKYLHSLKHEETEDAQIESKMAPVIPRISGYVKEVRVTDNQMVHKGDTLVILDDRDFQIHLVEAEAALAAAQSNLI